MAWHGMGRLESRRLMEGGVRFLEGGGWDGMGWMGHPTSTFPHLPCVLYCCTVCIHS